MIIIFLLFMVKITWTLNATSL